MVSAASTAAEILFKFIDDKEDKYIPEEQDQSYHHTTAQILCVRSQACRDIQTEVAFFITIFKQPDDD